ncbi:MAG: hypothetical protein DCC43_05375 [Candidatus Brocadia sp.]|jgi:hypothetical protein|uniref:Uncharacterized protein n=1 Tax=Candidatus Brocadia fulgida TaxID=380242 RepID=A0A0M2UW69_9BACT|nr:MAG: hypothetical protein BROFUL_00945 [Candidatus Brocadia fulgida]MCC6324771.1 hypothetical protein [Candidatus Brocadia sp.]MCE7911380.1 hypothetical protein [Candidatus Brocadia sp. AMX3]OQZ00690.1 MAG: hypothetical protein B6D35_05940 [Candidatus Brocadia sp. UTAMX2]MBV6518236.1 hypothetical protein [Candidatus Brocadia fulgida]
MPDWLRRLSPIGFAIAVLLVGCSTSSVFISYTTRMNSLLDGVKSRKFDYALKVLDKYGKGKDKILYRLERGRLAQIKNDLQVSMKDYATAMEAIQQREDKAIIRASDMGALTAAFLTNDNAAPYQGEGYEKVFLHQFQAFNYLENKDIEGAGVEVRRANLEQNRALEMHEKEVGRAEEKARERSLETEPAYASLNSAYRTMDDSAGKVKNSFQNAYTFYLSGIVYELLNQPNDAYIDYKKALQIFPENTYLQHDVMRLAKALGMNQELNEYASRFEKIQSEDEEGIGNANGGELVVLFENGFVPQKREIKVPIPTPNGFLAIAFPVYRAKWPGTEPLSLSEPERKSVFGETEPLCYVQALAVKALKEKVAGMVVRHLLRSATKAAFQYQAKDSGGSVGTILSSFYTVFSEKADLRSWLTLPQDVQIMRRHLPAGVHHLHAEHKASGAFSDVDVTINQNGKTILRIIRIGPVMYTTVIAF